ncbi:MAG: glycosyltransferase family A protein [Candidatus Moraniibacteriota bacterium]
MSASKNPQVSIITPVFNREELIIECIESIQNQDYKNYEHIIVDDCSTDNTAEVVKAYAKKDPRIVFVKSPKNSGGNIGKVRNIGIKIAKGELIAFLDSDDMWEKEKLSLQITHLQENKLDFSYHPLSRFMKNTDDTPMSFWGRDCFQKDYFRGLFLSNFISTCSVLTKKKVLEEVGLFDESLKYSEDYCLWLLIALKNYKIGFLNNVLGRFRRSDHGNVNAVLNKKEKHECSIRLREKILFEHSPESLPRLMKSDLIHNYIYYYYELIKTEDSPERKKELFVKIIDRLFELKISHLFIEELEFLTKLRKNN